MARTSKNSEHADNTEKMLDSIFTYTPKTRQEIAAESGLSLMTVGKTVDMLSEARLLLTAKAPTDSPGRKPSATYPDPEYYYILIDNTHIPGSVSVYDVTFGERTRIRIPEGFEYRTGCDRAEYINNLLMELAGEFNYFKCIGAGMLLGDTEDTASFAEDEAKFVMSPFSVRISTRCAAVKNILRIKESLPDGLTYYITLQPPRHGILFIGTEYHAGKTGVLGDIPDTTGTETASPKEIAAKLTEMRRLLKFDNAVITADTVEESAQLESALTDAMPDINATHIESEINLTHHGMLCLIRRGYLDKLTSRI